MCSTNVAATPHGRIEDAGGAAIYTRLDVTREDDWTAAIVAVTARFGALDILVNNAGLFLGMDIEEATLADWHRLCAVNLTGVFLGTKLALPTLRESAQKSPHGSAIVNLSSVAGLVGSPSDPLYSMTKGGVTLFTKSAALEFARKGTGSASTRSTRARPRPPRPRISVCPPPSQSSAILALLQASHPRPSPRSPRRPPSLLPRALPRVQVEFSRVVPSPAVAAVSQSRQ